MKKMLSHAIHDFIHICMRYLGLYPGLLRGRRVVFWYKNTWLVGDL